MKAFLNRLLPSDPYRRDMLMCAVGPYLVVFPPLLLLCLWLYLVG